MKINRSWLLAITAALGVSLIAYALIRQFTGFSLDERYEKTFFDGIFIAAIALFMYNRKLASDEKKAADKSLDEGVEKPDGGGDGSAES